MPVFHWLSPSSQNLNTVFEQLPSSKCKFYKKCYLIKFCIFSHGLLAYFILSAKSKCVTPKFIHLPCCSYWLSQKYMTGVISSVITFIPCFVKSQSTGLKIQCRFEWMDGKTGSRARAHTHTHTHTHTQTVISKTYLLKGSLSIIFIRTYSTVTTHNTTVKNWYDSTEKVEFAHVHHTMNTYEGMEV
jgi:hypothetical protein